MGVGGGGGGGAACYKLYSRSSKQFTCYLINGLCYTVWEWCYFLQLIYNEFHQIMGKPIRNKFETNWIIICERICC